MIFFGGQENGGFFFSLWDFLLWILNWIDVFNVIPNPLGAACERSGECGSSFCDGDNQVCAVPPSEDNFSVFTDPYDPRIFRGFVDGSKVTYYGQKNNETGEVISVDRYVLNEDGDDQDPVTVSLDPQGRPTRFVEADGSRLTIVYNGGDDDPDSMTLQYLPADNAEQFSTEISLDDADPAGRRGLVSSSERAHDAARPVFVKRRPGPVPTVTSNLPPPGPTLTRSFPSKLSGAECWWKTPSFEWKWRALTRTTNCWRWACTRPGTRLAETTRPISAVSFGRRPLGAPRKEFATKWPRWWYPSWTMVARFATRWMHRRRPSASSFPIHGPRALAAPPSLPTMVPRFPANCSSRFPTRSAGAKSLPTSLAKSCDRIGCSLPPFFRTPKDPSLATRRNFRWRARSRPRST